ncbi:hypothetical protein J4450_00405 [Candidatus Micrarchaeota archaeon]|nr:hypothetical protein [Candidatus Micrarchaeota archaeon]
MTGAQDAVSIYLFVIMLVSSVILGLIILTYLASKVLKLQSLEVWFNVELSEFFASFFILLFAIGFFTAANLIAAGMAGGGATSAIEAGSNFLKSTLSDTLKGINDVYLVQICVSVLSTLTRRIGEFVLTLTYKIFPGMDTFVGVTNVLGFGLTAAFGSLNAQLVIFQLIDVTMVRFFLPAGIILRFFPPTRDALRFFPPTRDAGIFLIAFAIGFQAVFPLTYVINEKILESMNYQGYVRQGYQLSTFCSSNYFIFGFIGSPLVSFPFGIGKVPVFGQLFRLIFSELGINMLTPIMFEPILDSLATLSLAALFLPALSLTITFSFINTFIKFVLMKI